MNAKWLWMAMMPLALCRIAQAEEVLDWKQCVLEARKNHPDLVSAAEKVNQFKASKMTAVSGLLPQVAGNLSAQSSKTDQRASSSSSISSGKRVDDYSYGINGSQLLFDGFKTALNVEQAVKNIESSQYNYLVTSSNVRLRLRTAFTSLLRAQEFLRLTEKIAERRKQNKEMIRLRYEAGRENKGSLLTAEADLAESNFEVDQAMRGKDVSLRQLAKELGRDKVTPVRVGGEFDLSQTDKIRPDYDKLAVTVPLLRQLIVQKEAARYGVKSAQAAFFPQIFASGSLAKTDSQWPPDLQSWSAGVSASMPFFDGGNLTSSLMKNRAIYQQSQADERSGRDGVLLTLEQTWAGFRDAWDQVGVQEKFLMAAQERERIATAQYSSGLISFNDWIIIEDNLVNAEKSYLNARAAALIAEAVWAQAKGETLDDE